jgi:Cu+-exporting ATPase
VDQELPTAMATDPVCGMQVDPGRTDFKVEHDGQTYFFCSRGCMLDFVDEPQKYLDSAYKPSMPDAHGH